MGVFFLCGQSFPSTWGHAIFPCGGGGGEGKGVLFSAWRGGGIIGFVFHNSFF